MNKFEPTSRSLIRGAFLRNGASIEEGRDDLPDWVFEGAFDLLEAVGAKPVEPDHIPDVGNMVLNALERVMMSKEFESLPYDCQDSVHVAIAAHRKQRGATQ